MDATPRDGFRPARLAPRDLEHPVAPHMRQMGNAELARIREDREKLWSQFDPWNPAQRRRLALYCAGAVVLFPIATWFFTPAGFTALHWQWAIAIPYGVAFAWLRPTGFLAPALTLAAGLGTQLVTGHAAASFALLMSLVFYGFVGAVLGVGERLKLGDGV
jgi:hypothetical protein